MMRVHRPRCEGSEMTEHRPWFASYEEGVPHTLEPYPEVNAFTMLEEAARKHPQSPALVWAVPGGRTLTFAQLLSDVERFSAALARLGVKQGDRVALILPN